LFFCPPPLFSSSTQGPPTPTRCWGKPPWQWVSPLTSRLGSTPKLFFTLSHTPLCPPHIWGFFREVCSHGPPIFFFFFSSGVHPTPFISRMSLWNLGLGLFLFALGPCTFFPCFLVFRGPSHFHFFRFCSFPPRDGTCFLTWEPPFDFWTSLGIFFKVSPQAICGRIGFFWVCASREGRFFFFFVPTTWVVEERAFPGPPP